MLLVCFVPGTSPAFSVVPETNAQAARALGVPLWMQAPSVQMLMSSRVSRVARVSRESKRGLVICELFTTLNLSEW